MNSSVTTFIVCVMLIVLPLMSSIARRRRFEASMKRYLDERTLRDSNQRKNQSVQQSSDKKFKKKSHDPSWDGE